VSKMCGCDDVMFSVRVAGWDSTKTLHLLDLPWPPRSNSLQTPVLAVNAAYNFWTVFPKYPAATQTERSRLGKPDPVT